MSVRVLILEDEPPAVAQLERGLRAWDPATVVEGVADSVREAVEWLRTHPEPDVILADIRLSDGVSLRVFDEVKVSCPVVFATAYDAYFVKAMERNAIDYLLKPIEAVRLARAMDKYVSLREHFGAKLASLSSELTRHAAEPSRIVARRGAGYVPVAVERVAWLTTEYKQTILVDVSGARLLVDEALGDLETILGGRAFRLNRQYLACAGAIASFESAGRGRVRVTLAPRSDDDVVVSQEIAAAFRAWVAR